MSYRSHLLRSASTGKIGISSKKKKKKGRQLTREPLSQPHVERNLANGLSPRKEAEDDQEEKNRYFADRQETC